MGTRQGGHVVWWSSTVPVLSFPLRGAWLAQDAQPQHTAPMAMLSPLSPTAAVDSPGCAPMVPGLSLGLGGRHVSLRQSVLWLRGAPALQSRCLPLPAAACHWYWAPSSVPRCPPLRHSQANSTLAGSHGGTSASGSHPHVCSWRSQFLCLSSGTALWQDWRSERTQPGGCVATSSGGAGDNAVGRLFPGMGSGGRTVPTSWAGGHPRG